MIHGLLMAFFLAAPPQETTFKVSGTVVRDDKQDPAQAAQQNQIRISGPNTLIMSIGEGGAFEFPNMRPGNYQIVVGPRITMTPVAVTITDKDVTGLRVVIPVTAGVNGNVTVEGGGPRPRFQVRFTRVDEPTAMPVNTTANPGFTSTMQPGQYRITVTGLPAGYNLKSITLNGADVLNQSLTVVAGASQTLSITLGVSSPPPWVKVSGRVTGGSATSVTMTGGASPETLTAAVGPGGTFEFPMVLPGNYSARTLPAVVLAGTTPVTVGSTNLTNLELRIPASKDVRGKITVKGNVPMPRLVLSMAAVGTTAPAATGTTVSIVNGVAVVGPAGSVSVPTNPGPDGTFRVTLPDGERCRSAQQQIFRANRGLSMTELATYRSIQPIA